MEGLNVVSVAREKIEKEEEVAEVVIEYGAVRMIFNRFSFDKNKKTGKFDRLRKNRPLKIRTDRGKDCWLPPVPFWDAVDMARVIFNEEREARG